MSRFSVESEDHRYLLSDNASITASSIYSTVQPSEQGNPSDSITPRPSTENIRRATVPMTASMSTSSEGRLHQVSQPYRGFPSEDAYLKALRSWAEEKQFLHLDTSMVGWYGTRTSEDYIKSSVPPTGLRSKLRERKAERQRRHTIEPTDITGSDREETVNDEEIEQNSSNPVETTGVDGSTRKKFVWPRRKSVGLSLTRTR